MSTSMTKGSPLKLMLQFALPLLMGNLLQQTYNIIDAAIVGQILGADALASVGSSSSVQFLVLGFCIGCCAGFGVPVARYFGAGDHRTMRNYIFNGAVLTAIIAAILMIACSLSCGQILHLLSVPDDIFGNAYVYLIVIFIGIPFTLLYNYLSSILRSVGDSRTPFMFLGFSAVLNIFLDILFIVPFKGGVAGAAWATILSQLLASLLCAVSGVRRYEELRLSRRDFSGLRRICIRELKIGFPMGFQMSVMCIGQLAMQSAVNGFGSMAVAGYTAATKADQVSVLVNNATASALSAYVSQNYGAGKWKRIRQGVHAALIQTQCLNLMMGVGILLLRRPIVEMFLANPPKEVIWYSNGYLNWVAPCYLILGALSIYRCAVQSMQNTAAPFIACMIELVMRIGSTLFICSLWGYTGVCIATPLAWIGAGSYVMFVYYNSMQRKMLPADCLSDTVKG